MKIAVFGGSFDPPHIGHMQIVQKALQDLDIDMFVIVPTYLNPFKKRFAAPPALRLRWLKKIFYHPKIHICDYEVKRGRPTFAIETVQFLRKRYHPTKIYYIIGSDNLPTLHEWHRYRKLSHLVEFVVATRPGYETKGKYHTLHTNLPISSTELRTDPKQKYLPKIVAREIIRFYRQ